MEQRLLDALSYRYEALNETLTYKEYFLTLKKKVFFFTYAFITEVRNIFFVI